MPLRLSEVMERTMGDIAAMQRALDDGAKVNEPDEVG